VRKNLSQLEAFFSDRSFLLYVLAFVGVLCMPTNWFVAVSALVASSFTYGYLKRNPGTLKDADWWKRSEIQRCGVFATVWFWWWFLSSASYRGLLSLPFVNAGIFTLTIVPMVIYLVCAGHSMAAWPKAAAGSALKSDRKKMQMWTDSTLVGFLAAFVFSVTTIVWFPGGIGSWLQGWLDASFSDAMCQLGGSFAAFTTCSHLDKTFLHCPLLENFPVSLNIFVCLVVVSLFFGWAVRLAGFLTSWLKLAGGRLSAEMQEAFLRTLRMPRTCLSLRESRGFMKNAVSSLAWLAVCWAALFAVVGLSSGGLGHAMVGWLDASIADARTGMVYGASANQSLRLFCAAVVALYGTVPLAVTAAVFLPYLRRRQIVLDADGLFFPDGPYFSAGFRARRLWSDLASIDLKTPAKAKDLLSGKLIIKFHSGGKIVLGLKQLRAADLEKLLAAVDENALECRVSEELLGLKASLRARCQGRAGKSELGALAAQQFQSTIFVTHEPGSWLPDGETRVVRLLASRPLSCVYLVRDGDGKLAIAKQFFLAEESRETLALRKCFAREYELLGKLDHPAVSKVRGVFQKDQSTYLVIEHASGVDLATLVGAQGPRAEEKVWSWAMKLCEIMSYLHGQDPPVVHRDLTPDNLVLAEDGSLRIIDFGAAHQFLEGITGTVIGKQCYVSPEQLQGRAGVASDIYSFGCTLYFLLTGEEPVALSQCNPSAKAYVSSELSDLVMACTEFDEKKRPQSFEEVKARLIEVHEKPVRELLTKFKQVAESQGIAVGDVKSDVSAGKTMQTAETDTQTNETDANPNKRTAHDANPAPATDSYADPGVVIQVKEYEEQLKPS
jgi:hypothetical protein